MNDLTQNGRLALTWRWALMVGLLLACLARPPLARAHVGAPYPVLLEETAGPYVASALADPDVGTGTFYILIAQPDGQPVPTDTNLTVWIVPEDGHLAESGYLAQREKTRYGERFVAKVPFDSEGPWQIRLAIDGQAGNGEISFPVQVTPSGLGWLATLMCLVPFLLLGFLWLRGTMRQRARP